MLKLRPFRVLLSSFFCLSGSGWIIPGSATAGQTLIAPPHAAGVIVVKPRTGLPKGELHRILWEAGVDSAPGETRTGLSLVSVPPGKELELTNRIRQNPHIEFVELDRIAIPDAGPAPTDPRTVAPWHLDTIGALAHRDSYSGQHVTVAVVDTGVEVDHPALRGLVLPGYNGVDGSSNTVPIHPHGTMVAGVIAAQALAGEGLESIAPRASILPVKISNRLDGSAQSSDIAAGIAWAADQGAKVINVSYGSLNGVMMAEPVMREATDYARARGSVVIASAGNEGRLLEASAPINALIVGATDSKSSKADFSNYGDPLDLWAPGVDIPTTSLHGTYDLFTGTSASAPVAAGALTQFFSINPRIAREWIGCVI